MKHLFTTLMVLSTSSMLLGCGIARQQQYANIKSEYQESMALCNKEHSDGTTKTYVAFYKCRTRVSRTAILATGMPHHDLVKLHNAHAMEQAELLDNGKISKIQFDARIAEINSELESQIRQRNQQGVMANAAQRQAYAASQQAMAAMKRAWEPPQSTRMSTTCTTLGNSVTCQ